MKMEKQIKFHGNRDKNDLSAVEKVLAPVFTNKSEQDRTFWEAIKALLLSSVETPKTDDAPPVSIWEFIWPYIDKTIRTGIQQGQSLFEIEAVLRASFRKPTDTEKSRKEAGILRAKRNFEKVEGYILGDKVLDLGAGDGLLALEIKERMGKDVTLVDVLDYNYTHLPLVLYPQDGAVPLDDMSVDSTILYVVLHHANNPLNVLKEAARVTRNRIVILEGSCEEETIRVTNSFVDWFFNRVLRDEDINVPLNYLPLRDWEYLIEQVGFKVTGTKYIGIDEPLAPEHHVFIIADRK